MQEKTYLLYRDLRAAATKVVFLIGRIFPVKKKKIVFCNLEGQGGYGCNPKYIAEELIKRKKADIAYELVWITDDIMNEFPKEIKAVPNTLWSRAYHLNTAGVWIDNSRKPLGTIKRKNQMYIQTWHGAIGFKPVGKLRGAALPKIAYKVSANDSKMIDYFISNSDWSTNICKDGFLYEGKVIKTGSPRCDILINNREEQYSRIRKEHNLPDNAKILMYAPTFRGGSQKAVRKVNMNSMSLDFERLLASLEQKSNEEWYVFTRLHPQLASQLKLHPLEKQGEKVIDVSLEDDMYEILAGMDALITDYSSAGFDACSMKLPVFIYADDLKDYTSERGKLLWDMYALPFSIATNNDELIENISKFDKQLYEVKLEQFFAQVNLLEDGHASERIADLIG